MPVFLGRQASSIAVVLFPTLLNLGDQWYLICVCQILKIFKLLIIHNYISDGKDKTLRTSNINSCSSFFNSKKKSFLNSNQILEL